MGMYKTFETDKNLERDGVIVDYGDFRVKLAHAGQGNKEYVSYAEKKMKPIRKALAVGAVSNERSQSIMADIYAQTVVLSWEVRSGEEWKEGIESRDGSILEFSKKNVEEALIALPALFLDIQEQAMSIANYRKEELEDESKN